MNILLALALCASVLHSALSYAEPDEVPVSCPDIGIVSAEEVQSLLPRARIIDTRAVHDFLAGHLPSAIHVPYRERSAREINYDPSQDGIPEFLSRLHKFAADKNATMIFYCNGLTCWKSYKGARAALKDGYHRVYWFRDGMAGWNAKKFEVVLEIK